MTKTFAPANAPRVFTDGRDIFAEFPAKGDNPPYVARYPFTENGVGKLMKIVPSILLEPGYTPIAEKIIPKPIRVAKRTESKRKSAKFSAAAKARLREIVRKVKY